MSRPVTEPRSIRVRRLLRTGLRRVSVIVGAYSIIAAALIIVSCAVDDLRIDQDMGSAIATVTEVTPRRAAIEFDTPYGRHIRPENGVFYPTGLSEGQHVRVEYRRANPELVRVSGRSWTVALWPALSLPVFALPLCALVHRLASPRSDPRWTPRIHRRSPSVD